MIGVRPAILQFLVLLLLLFQSNCACPNTVHNVRIPLVKDRKVSTYLFPKRKCFDHYFLATLHGRVPRECDIALCVPYKPKYELFNRQIISFLPFLVNPKTTLQDCRSDPDHYGPLKQKTNFPRIKLDLTAHEKVVLSPEKREIFHNYSDKPATAPLALSYCYEEIFAEKLRALAERARPRDLYDVIYLYEGRHRLSDKSKFLESLSAKCEFKKIPVPTLEYIQRHPQKNILSSEWENMLRHQLPELKSFEYFWEQLQHVFEWATKS